MNGLSLVLEISGPLIQLEQRSAAKTPLIRKEKMMKQVNIEV